MAPVVTLYIATTLDGFIARADGGIDWLTQVDDQDNDYGYEAFYNTVDGLLMGSATYDMINSFGEWPYPNKHTFVFTRRAMQSDRRDVHFIAGDPQQVVRSPQFERFKHLWLVGGSTLIADCVQKNLIDQYILTMVPLLLGHGLRLFPSPMPEQWLSLVSSEQFDRGILQLRLARNS